MYPLFSLISRCFHFDLSTPIISFLFIDYQKKKEIINYSIPKMIVMK